MTTGLRIDPTKEHHVLRWTLAFVIVSLLLAGLWFGYNWYTKGDQPPVISLPASAIADTSVDETPITKQAIDSYSVPATHPKYISLPTMGVSKARVVSVGLTKLNTLDTPKNIGDTAWFTKSATPGTGTGAVVIDGHNGGVTRDGIFAHLDQLKEGDTITVERGDGQKFNYIVKTNVTMSLQEANNSGMQDMMKSIDPTKEGLSLITCAGKWVPRDKVFDKRIMVRAVAE